jgi:hypothetical protein
MLNHQQPSIWHLPTLSFSFKAEYSAPKVEVLMIIRRDNSQDRMTGWLSEGNGAQRECNLDSDPTEPRIN